MAAPSRASSPPRAASFQAQLLSAVSQAVIATDLEGTITHWNPAAEKLYGWRAEEVMGRNIVDVTPSAFSQEQARAIMAALAKGQPWSGEFEVQRKDGTRFVAFVRDTPLYDDEGRLAGVVGVSEDVTAKREAENALQTARLQISRAEKLAAMGSLVGGVAHEIRTPLAYAQTSLFVLQARAKAARDRSDPFPDPEELLEPAFEGLERISGIVEALRRFTQLDESQRVKERLEPVIREALRLLRATHPRGADLAEALGQTPPVRLSRLQMQQVALNLMENALDASTGIVRVSTERVEGGVRLVVEDDGPGVPPELRERVFEEFFTTKPEGSGLGLAIVRRIVTDHEGRVWNEPVKDDAQRPGTRFVVELPAATDEGDAADENDARGA